MNKFQQKIINQRQTFVLCCILNLKIIYHYIGTGKHQKMINVSEIVESKGEDYCTTIRGLNMFTGEDVTSAFKGNFLADILYTYDILYIGY